MCMTFSRTFALLPLPSAWRGVITVISTPSCGAWRFDSPPSTSTLVRTTTMMSQRYGPLHSDIVRCTHASAYMQHSVYACNYDMVLGWVWRNANICGYVGIAQVQINNKLFEVGRRWQWQWNDSVHDMSVMEGGVEGMQTEDEERQSINDGDSAPARLTTTAKFSFNLSQLAHNRPMSTIEFCCIFH